MVQHEIETFFNSDETLFSVYVGIFHCPHNSSQDKISSNQESIIPCCVVKIKILLCPNYLDSLSCYFKIAVLKIHDITSLFYKETAHVLHS